MGLKTIQAVSIRNYRGLASTEVAGLGRVNVVVGRNGAGKTSLLEALALACLGNRPEQLLWVSLSRGGILNRGSLESIFGVKGEAATIKLKTDLTRGRQLRAGRRRVRPASTMARRPDRRARIAVCCTKLSIRPRINLASASRGSSKTTMP